MNWIQQTEQQRLKWLHIQSVFSKTTFSLLAFVEILALRHDIFSSERTLAATFVLGALAHIPTHLYRKTLLQNIKNAFSASKVTYQKNWRLQEGLIKHLYPQAQKYNGSHYLRLESESNCLEFCKVSFKAEGRKHGTLMMNRKNDAPTFMENDIFHINTNLSEPLHMSDALQKSISKQL